MLIMQSIRLLVYLHRIFDYHERARDWPSSTEKRKPLADNFFFFCALQLDKWPIPISVA